MRGLHHRLGYYGQGLLQQYKDYVTVRESKDHYVTAGLVGRSPHMITMTLAQPSDAEMYRMRALTLH